MSAVTPVQPDRVKVRMYKGLLGDCLLLTLEAGKDEALVASHILIDCGVLQGTKGAADRMQAVVEDIFKATGEKGLDLVVVTHEHHDHISGFKLARDVFADEAMANLWFAWTEDPKDDVAKVFQEQFGNGFAILGSLASKLNVQNLAAADEPHEMLGLAGFSGPFGFDEETKKPVARGSREIYAWLVGKIGLGQTEFLKPGKVCQTPGKLGLRTYVLGPPRDLDAIKRALPTAGGHETYLGAAAGGTGGETKVSSPFDDRAWKKPDEIAKAGMKSKKDDGVTETHRRYFANTRSDLDFDQGADQVCRQIELSERSVFANLALKMDNWTNNTSLVLAFDLPGKAGTMLFAADAQVGNWLSWGKVEFREKPEDDPLPIKTDELLARTRFYKVGHHGSHNATLSEDGLEKMLGPDFVAMVPTDAAFAKQQSSGWLMPNPRVEEALLNKGLVLRGDRTLDQAIAARATLLAKDMRKEKAAWAKERVTETDLFVEYTIYDRDRDDPEA